MSFAIEENKGASDLESVVLRAENEQQIIAIFKEEILREYGTHNTPGYLNVAIVLAYSDFDFTPYKEVINEFIPRLKNIIQQLINKLKETENKALALEIKQLQLDLINKYKTISL